MTAEICIMNRSSVALAADSAMTSQTAGVSKFKLSNTANKIFNLSQQHTVGVMVYNSAEFMGVPWETIIKLYRNILGTKQLNTVNDYHKTFIDFIQKNISWFPKKIQQAAIDSICVHSFNINIDKTENLISKHYDKLSWNRLGFKEQQKIFLDYFNKSIDESIEEIKRQDFLDNFKNALKDLESNYGKYIIKKIEVMFKKNNIPYSQTLSNKSKDIIFNCIRRKIFLGDWSGVVFAGFGEKQIFPSIVEVKIGGVILDNIRHTILKNR